MSDSPSNPRRAYRIFCNTLSFSSLPNTIALTSEYFRKLETNESLNVWSLAPPELDFSSFEQLQIFPWRMDQLLREAFTHNCFLGIRNINKWDSFAIVYKALHHVNTEVEKGMADKIWYQLYRISHLQFPWQERLNGRYLYRYIKIFEHLPLKELVYEKYNVTPSELFKFTFALYGWFLSNRTLKGGIDASKLGLSQKQTKLILNSITTNTEEVSNDSFDKSIADVNFEYRRSIFVQKPLLKLYNQSGEDCIICPIPRYLVYRLLDGLYYDLVGHRSFANAFGLGFQNYIETLSSTHLQPRISVRPEQPYGIGKASVDLILSDENADVFVECKARRASYSGITDLTTKDSIDRDLTKISEALSKTYKNIFDGLNGKYTHWQPSGKRKYLLVVFPKNWFASYPALTSRINQLTEQHLNKIGISPKILTEIPYEICSADAYEYFCATAQTHSLSEIMSTKSTKEFSNWDLRNFLNNQYRDSLDENLRNISNIEDAFDLIFQTREQNCN